MFHESLAATEDMAVLLSELEAGRPRVSHPATYHSGTPRVRHPVVARWHAYLPGLTTAIHETSGLDHWSQGLPGSYLTIGPLIGTKL